MYVEEFTHRSSSFESEAQRSKQQLVVSSSLEAKYVDATSLACPTKWPRLLAGDHHHQQKEATKIFL